MGAGWGWVFIGTVLVTIGLYVGLGMIITRGKFPVSRALPHATRRFAQCSRFEFTRPLLLKCSTQIFGPGLSPWFATGCGGPLG